MSRITKKRILATCIDFLVLSFVLVLSGIILGYVFGVSNEVISRYKPEYIIAGIFFLRDIIGGRSLGKRFMGIKVVTMEGEIPGLFKLVIRNIFAIIWFIELGLLVFRGKRIGDIVTHTEVVLYNK